MRVLLDLSPDEPVRHLADSASRLGLLPFSHDIGNDTADAGMILLSSGGVAFVNSHQKVGRRRLALAHELGHYLVADDYVVDWRVDDHSIALESRLDRFARSLLLPSEALESRWAPDCERYGERETAIRFASEYRVDMATLASRLNDLRLADKELVNTVRQWRTTQSDIIEMSLHVPLEEMKDTSVPRPYARAVLGLVRAERISRERALELLRGTVEEPDLPVGRQRRADEIWNFVS